MRAGQMRVSADKLVPAQIVETHLDAVPLFQHPDAERPPQAQDLIPQPVEPSGHGRPCAPRPAAMPCKLLGGPCYLNASRRLPAAGLLRGACDPSDLGCQGGITSHGEARSSPARRLPVYQRPKHDDRNVHASARYVAAVSCNVAQAHVMAAVRGPATHTVETRTNAPTAR